MTASTSELLFSLRLTYSIGCRGNFQIRIGLECMNFECESGSSVKNIN